ncbi:alanine racemase [Arthrobacter sp. zg-Y820]|uniref:alanine racemase n=1 Tax=unclassified Arthrobacter TaxID=235627 RepID=UPI0025402AFD|nr:MULTISPECIES: alanine racemase [unclassified Arthrobacter]MCC9195835.1 alanine racemase [Arthrobacter sp. zg-Y820]MDK1278695.1 alanine racemase [Arthrobacter sp. zg.Y820]MDK1359707.1 alanine racemase [Arthrobacter sp. zg-Y1219]WIB08876.1 alanine racemase [Arthrobacter sp. zg-Y820]
MNDQQAPPAAERQALVDLAAVRHNVRHLVRLASPARVMAVVKADAYGHGAVPVARAALEAGASWLGVAHISEALALRGAGITAPLLAWLHTVDSQFSEAVAANVDLGLSGWELEHVAAAARELQIPARVHLKIDTGLGRNGCPPEKWESFVGRALAYQEEGLLRVVGIFSHFSVADEPDRPETDEQLERFRTAVAVAEDAGVDREVRHIANTPAALSRPDSHFDMVRVGLGLYGLSPFPGQTPDELGLRPAMTLKTTIANCKEVPAGQGVSYGLRYTAPEATTLALVPLGYADGVPRIGTGGPVWVDGTVYPVVGRIAMDQMVIDLNTTGIAGTGKDLVGREAVLFGGVGLPSVDEWAEACGSINYEIITRISSRVERKYTDTEATEA